MIYIIQRILQMQRLFPYFPLVIVDCLRPSYFSLRTNPRSSVHPLIYTFLLPHFTNPRNLQIYNLLMHKGEQTNAKKPLTKRTNRIPARDDRTAGTFNYQTPTSNYLITVNVVQPPKSSEKNEKHTKNEQKIKKIKFITEGIEKSTQDLLDVRSHSNQKHRSIKQSSQNIEDERAYEICKSHKKSQKSNQDEKKGHNRLNSKDNLLLGNLKARKVKHMSKDHHRLTPREPCQKKPSKSNKKVREDPKTTRESLKEHCQKQYLSPDLVQLQNSYYFSSNDEEDEYLSKLEPPQHAQQTNPSAGKRERKYIFESNQSVWQDKPSKVVMNSIINPLSDY